MDAPDQDEQDEQHSTSTAGHADLVAHLRRLPSAERGRLLACCDRFCIDASQQVDPTSLDLDLNGLHRLDETRWSLPCTFDLVCNHACRGIDERHTRCEHITFAWNGTHTMWDAPPDWRDAT